MGNTSEEIRQVNDRRRKNAGNPSGNERRSGDDRRRRYKIPIFLKLITLSALVTALFITTISYVMLSKQKRQFQEQLITFGESTLRFASEQLPDKLLAEEELLLFQIVNNIAEDQQVLFALVANAEKSIKAHSDSDKVNKPYEPPENLTIIKNEDGVMLGHFQLGAEECYYLEKKLAFQGVPVGTAALAVTQRQIVQNLSSARQSIYIFAAMFIILGALFSIGLGAYISTPIRRLKESTVALRQGNFDQRVKISRNDELGDLGNAFNQMLQGLKERDKMRHSLELAMEIQRSLLPQAVPVYQNLDIAGHSTYCDETGGDYYDFIESTAGHDGILRSVIGDVSGHGIPSALVMATARALIRQRSEQPGSIHEIVTDVNRLLSRDVFDSGNFMTMFYLEIDMREHSLAWVRAGHDPAILYNTDTDMFEELKGNGIPLGVDGDWQFESHYKHNLKPGQIILLSTDGVWETFNHEGKMLGKEPIYDTIRKYKTESAQKITAEIFSELDQYRQGLPLEDDVTLVVMKIK